VRILLSIKPEFVDKIFSGEKLYEYRKSIFRKSVSRVIVYCTKPVGMIVGEFQIEEVIEDCPRAIWNRTKKFSGVEKEFYLKYFEGRSKGYAIKIGVKTLYEKPVDPYTGHKSFFPPQSFMYLNYELEEGFCTQDGNEVIDDMPTILMN
jgi:predicted transcriptional regulator